MMGCGCLPETKAGLDHGFVPIERDVPFTRSDRDRGILIPSMPVPALPSGSAEDTHPSDGWQCGALMCLRETEAELAWSIR